MRCVIIRPEGTTEIGDVGGWSDIKHLLSEGYMRPCVFGDVVMYVDEHAERKRLPVNPIAVRAVKALVAALHYEPLAEYEFRGVAVFVGAQRTPGSSEVTEVALPEHALASFDLAPAAQEAAA